MSWLRRVELIEPYYCPPPAVLLRESAILFAPLKLAAFPAFFEEDEDEDEFELGCALDLLCPKTPSLLSYKLIQRVERLGGELYLQSLSDRVVELEARFDRLAKVKAVAAGDRKYTYTAEIKVPAAKNGLDGDRKYKWTTEIKAGEKSHHNKKKGEAERKYKWTTEIEGKGEISRKYIITASSIMFKKLVEVVAREM